MLNLFLVLYLLFLFPIQRRNEVPRLSDLCGGFCRCSWRLHGPFSSSVFRLLARLSFHECSLVQRVLYLFVQGSGHRGFFWICTNGVPSEQCAMKKGCRRPSCRVSWRARPGPARSRVFDVLYSSRYRHITMLRTLRVRGKHEKSMSISGLRGYHYQRQLYCAP